ncbi:MAG: FecR family protein [Verrucomicrobiota bacterium]|nr:FecR family protein [Verrucomicrobiota bacterium]
MDPTNRTLLALALGAMLAARIGMATDAIGRVVAAEGQATVTHADGKSGALAVDSPVFLGDRVTTGEKSKLQIRFSDDSAISQGEKSELVIDQYVYNPNKKEENGYATRMLKGVFRLITGKITELNPERFKVSTKMATIGIRGCELGFRLQDRAEDIYIIDVTEGQRIVVEALEMARDLAGRVLDVQRGGVTVSLLEGAGMTQRPMTLQETTQLMQEATPKPKSDRPAELVRAIGAVVQEATARVTEAASTRTAAAVLSEAVGGSDALGNFTGPSEPPPTHVTPPKPPPTRLEIGGGPFSDWDWGIWDDGSVSYHGNFTAANDFQAIVASGIPYDLISKPANSGQAGAYLSRGGVRAIVKGTCDLNVQVNVSPVPQWGGSFDMNNSNGDALSFTVNLGTGTVDPATGNISLPDFADVSHTAAYAMRLGGVNYARGSILREGLNGRLVAHTAGGPITGVAGSFYFLHAGTVRADGVFGSDLQAR